LTDKNANEKKSRSGKLYLLIIALLLLFLLQWKISSWKNDRQEQAHIADSLAHLQADSLARLDAQRHLDSLLAVQRADSLRRQDSLELYKRTQDSLRMVRGRSRAEFQAMWQAREDSVLRVKDSIQKVQDSIRFIEEEKTQALAKHREDSIHVADSTAHADSTRKALRDADKTPPVGQLLPPPGRYYQDVAVRVVCAEPKCQGQWSLNDTTHPSIYADPIPLHTSAKLWWRVVDTVGNSLPWQQVEYDLAGGHGCGKNSFPVPVKGKMICVDAYEYPNEAEQLPKDMVSQEEAAMLCAKAGKRLCALDEWQLACNGKEHSKYPYGDRYDEKRCATVQTKAERSGRKEGCRSWWGMNDMAGNLWEWTSTPHPGRSSYFDVAGGSWNTEDESACTSTKFSFYPQNQYPFVGFRCCADAP